MKQPHHILAVRIAHPVWTLFLLALALAVDHTGIVRLGLLCSCLHECGHLLVWVLLTRLPPTLIICPTGFCLSLRGVVLTPKQFIILAAAGPAVNLVLAAGGIAWLLGHPASYRLCYFIAANLLLGAFNLAGWLADQLQPGYPVSFQDPNPEAFLRELRLHFALFWAII
jgi:stage IV sporulation protein FB